MLHIASKNSSSSLTSIAEDDIQPNACDLRLKKVFRIVNNTFYLSNNHKQHRGSYEIMPDAFGKWCLIPGSYEIIMSGDIQMGPDEAGWVIPRSSLNRNGIFITTGLYDSGYKGPMAACMHVTCGDFEIEMDTRIAQFLLFKAESLHQYNGQYGYNADGSKKQEQDKFSY